MSLNLYSHNVHSSLAAEVSKELKGIVTLVHNVEKANIIMSTRSSFLACHLKTGMYAIYLHNPHVVESETVLPDDGSVLRVAMDLGFTKNSKTQVKDFIQKITR